MIKYPRKEMFGTLPKHCFVWAGAKHFSFIGTVGFTAA
jgi:hypothetical protein